MTDLESRVERLEDEVGVEVPDEEPRRVVGQKQYRGPAGEIVIGFDGSADNPLAVYRDGELVGRIYMNHLAEFVEDSE